MAFTVQEYLDLVRLLGEHPEWRSELRRLLLSEDLLALPETIRELVEVQRRTEERLERLEETVEKLAEAQRRTEERLERLEETVEKLAEAQRRTEEQLEALAEAQRRTEERLEALAEAQRRTEERLEALAEAQRQTEERMEGLIESQRQIVERLEKLEITTKTLVKDVAHLKGRSLEMTYRDRAGAYFGSILLRTRVVTLDSLEEKLEVFLSEEEQKDVLLLDLIVKGRPRQRPDISEVFLAVEVSVVICPEDAERAQRRASLLRKAGYRAIPVVAGEQITFEAENAARLHQVAVLQDGGRVSLWEEALQAWIDQKGERC